jgi:hypothetical protein
MEGEMFQENEAITLLIGLGALLFTLIKRRELLSLQASGVLIAALSVLLAGWLFTVLEDVLWEWLLNPMEHLCYAVSSILMAVWCWVIFMRRKRAEP